MILSTYFYSINAQNYEELQKILPDTILSYKDLKFSYSLDIDGNYAVIGSQSLHKAYVFHYNGSEWQKVARLALSDENESAYLGYPVSIDDNVIVVGAVQGNNHKGAAYVFVRPGSGWTDMTETAKLTASDVAPYDNFAISLDISDDVIAAGARGADYDKGAVYVFVKPSGGWTDMTETGKLTASDAAQSDNMGFSVSISGDVIITNVSRNDPTGRVYLFEKPSSGWGNMTQTAILTSSDAAKYDGFASTGSISISNDVITVGAYGYNGNGYYSGKVYLFEKPSGGWTNMTETATLLPSDGAAYDFFGDMTYISGNTIIVGARSDDNQKGSAYIFEKPDDGWKDMTQTAKLTSSVRRDKDKFGYVVGISGDIAFCSAPESDLFGSNSGAVFAFHKPESGWIDASEDHILNGDGKIETDNKFGYSVDIDGDYAVVGQYGANSGTGIAYVYKNNGTTWNKVAKLTATDCPYNSNFGFSVGISGNTIVVGAYQNNAAYVFEKPISGWADMKQTAKLTSSDVGAADQFGYSVSIDDNIIAVGAHRNCCQGTYSGAVYVFEKPVSGWTDMTQTAKLTTSNGEYEFFLGLSTDINNNTIIAAANKPEKGLVYVYKKPVSGWTDMSENAIMTAAFENAEEDEYKVHSVSVSPNTIVAGLTYTDEDWEEHELVCVYEKTGSEWTSMDTPVILTPSGDDNIKFGNSVYANDNLIAVGAPDDGNVHSGVVYMFEKPEGGWTDMNETYMITATDANISDYFGQGLAMSGDILLIGAKGVDETARDNGAAYFFRIKSSSTRINKNEQEKLTLFPNPASDYIRINKICTNIEIYNIAGQKIMSINNPDISGTINVSDLPKGSYMLKVKLTGDKYRVIKFIKK